MTEWRTFPYLLPDDHFATLEQIMVQLPEGDEMEMTWEKAAFFVAVVADPKAALMLHLQLENGRPSADDGTALLEENELWVKEEERAHCEELLATLCPSNANWQAIAFMHFASAEAHYRFGQAYTLATGIAHSAHLQTAAPSTVRTM
jgi:hypothetical protein